MPCVARNNCLALIIHPLHAAAAGGEDDDDDVGNENGSETVGATTIGPRGLPIDCVSIVLEYADATLLGAAASLSRDVSSTLRSGKYWRTLVRSKWGMLWDEVENDAEVPGIRRGIRQGKRPPLGIVRYTRTSSALTWPCRTNPTCAKYEACLGSIGISPVGSSQGTAV